VTEVGGFVGSADDVDVLIRLLRRVRRRLHGAGDPGTVWARYVDEARREHPNAFTAWSATAMADLRRRYRSGATIAELSAQLGRSTGSITAKLVEIGEIELPRQPVEDEDR
jgi:hypothetical protein